jgi:hypothetical protein
MALLRTKVSDELNASIDRVKSQRARNNGSRNNRSTHIVLLRSLLHLLVSANVFPSSLIIDTLMMKAIRSSETSVVIRALWRNIPEDGILHRNYY